MRSPIREEPELTHTSTLWPHHQQSLANINNNQLIKAAWVIFKKTKDTMRPIKRLNIRLTSVRTI